MHNLQVFSLPSLIFNFPSYLQLEMKRSVLVFLFSLKSFNLAFNDFSEFGTVCIESVQGCKLTLSSSSRSAHEYTIECKEVKTSANSVTRSSTDYPFYLPKQNFLNCTQSHSFDITPIFNIKLDGYFVEYPWNAIQFQFKYRIKSLAIGMEQNDYFRKVGAYALKYLEFENPKLQIRLASALTAESIFDALLQANVAEINCFAQIFLGSTTSETFVLAKDLGNALTKKICTGPDGGLIVHANNTLPVPVPCCCR